MTIAPLTFPKTFYGDAPPAAEASPLSPAHLTELELSNQRAKKIRRALSVAQTDAWLCAIFAALTLLSGLFSIAGLLLGLALAGCACNSFRGAKRLKSFDLSGPRLLAVNQLFLAAAIIAYAAWSIHGVYHGDSELLAALQAEPALATSLVPMQNLVRLAYLAVYGGLIVGTILAQGLAALYYATRRKHLAAYIEQTPAWILELQKINSRD